MTREGGSSTPRRSFTQSHTSPSSAHNSPNDLPGEPSSLDSLPLSTRETSFVEEAFGVPDTFEGSARDLTFEVFRLDPEFFLGRPCDGYVTRVRLPFSLEELRQLYGGGLYSIKCKFDEDVLVHRRIRVAGPPILTRSGETSSRTSSSNGGGVGEDLEERIAFAVARALPRPPATPPPSAEDVAQRSFSFLSSCLEVTDKLRSRVPADGEQPPIPASFWEQLGGGLSAAVQAFAERFGERAAAATAPLPRRILPAPVPSKRPRPAAPAPRPTAPRPPVKTTAAAPATSATGADVSRLYAARDRAAELIVEQLRRDDVELETILDQLGTEFPGLEELLVPGVEELLFNETLAATAERAKAYPELVERFGTRLNVELVSCVATLVSELTEPPLEEDDAGEDDDAGDAPEPIPESA